MHVNGFTRFYEREPLQSTQDRRVVAFDVTQYEHFQSDGTSGEVVSELSRGWNDGLAIAMGSKGFGCFESLDNSTVDGIVVTGSMRGTRRGTGVYRFLPRGVQATDFMGPCEMVDPTPGARIIPVADDDDVDVVGNAV